MWEKVKNIFSIIGAVLSVVLFTVLLFLLRRGSSDGRRSTTDTERTFTIQDGIAESERRNNNIERECTERSTRAEERIAECERHIQRAESILRGAIERSRKKE